tara:strand:- start:2379 stop:3182 length:804 start_codon:yes stop_codon:yes gene_type:complete
MFQVIIFLLKILYSFFITTSGLFIGFVVVSKIYYSNNQINDNNNLKNEKKFCDKYKDVIIRKKFFENHYDTSSDTSDEDSDTENIELMDKPCDVSEYSSFFKDKYVTIEHEIYQKIHMMWNSDENIYIYFSRSREVPYNILDVLCRKFVLSYDLCDYYVINFDHDYQIENEDENENDSNEDKNENDSNDTNDDFEQIEHDNVFFSMVKKSEKRKKNEKKYDKEINHFKYGGTLYEFKTIMSKDKEVSEPKKINYSEFKFDNINCNDK